jgi:hypothetical protein
MRLLASQFQKTSHAVRVMTFLGIFDVAVAAKLLGKCQESFCLSANRCITSISDLTNVNLPSRFKDLQVADEIKAS